MTQGIRTRPLRIGVIKSFIQNFNLHYQMHLDHAGQIHLNGTDVNVTYTDMFPICDI